ncbi:MAG: hypothetical protein ABIT71_05240 [Vicinamibacteraceae bacterium]
MAIALYVIASRDLVSAITGRPPGPMFNGVGSLTSMRWVVANLLGSVSNALLNGVILSMLYVPPTWLVGGGLTALALFAFVQSRAGAPLFGRLLED